MIATVLVPLDGSLAAEQAIPYAKALLPDAGAGVLLRVVLAAEPVVVDLVWPLSAMPDGDSGPAFEAARAALDETIARVADGRVRWVAKVERGDPATQILWAIEENSVDAVVMTTHGRGAIGRALFGSVADRVSYASPVPVLLVRPNAKAPASPTADLRRLMVPVDGSDLAEGAFPLAIELAHRHRVPVHLVRAIDLTAILASIGGVGIPPMGLSAEVYDQVVATIRSDAKEYLTGAAARLKEAGVSTTWALLEGSPFWAIADAAETGDLLVMTSHGRGGVLRWLLGSVAEKLVRESLVPVLLVPSAGRGMEIDAG